MSFDSVPSDLMQRYESLVANDDFVKSATINTSDDATLYIRFKKAFEILGVD
jgi:hypothetical protein